MTPAALFSLTGKSYAVPSLGGTIFEARLERDCTSDDLMRLVGQDVDGIGLVADVERRCVVRQLAGWPIGLLVRDALK